MKTKIFEALKREYSPLGLGDTFLQGFAERLAASGTITDENLAEQITAQKPVLEIIQSNMDARVNTAQKKWQEDQAKALADAAAEADRKRAELQKQQEALIAKQKEEYEKQIEDLRKKIKVEPAKPTEKMTQEEIIEQYKAQEEQKRKEKEAQEKAWREQREAYEAERKAEQEKRDAAYKSEMEDMRKAQQEQFDKMMAQMKEQNDTNASLKTQLETLNAEKEAAKKAADTAARNAAITAKAKELGIPDWRIAEGFTIADDADETKYTEVLTGIANNIKTNLLPPKTDGGSVIPVDDKTPEKDEIDNIAKTLFSKR